MIWFLNWENLILGCASEPSGFKGHSGPSLDVSLFTSQFPRWAVILLSDTVSVVFRVRGTPGIMYVSMGEYI